MKRQNSPQTWGVARDTGHALCVAFDRVDGRAHGPCTVGATVATDSAATVVDSATAAGNVATGCTVAFDSTDAPGELHSRRRIGDGA